MAAGDYLFNPASVPSLVHHSSLITHHFPFVYRVVYRFSQRKKKGSREAPLVRVTRVQLHDEQGQEREEHERFDERQAQQQHREDAPASAGIACRAFAGSRNRAAIAERAAERRNADRERRELLEVYRAAGYWRYAAGLRHRRADDQQRHQRRDHKQSESNHRHPPAAQASRSAVNGSSSANVANVTQNMNGV